MYGNKVDEEGCRVTDTEGVERITSHKLIIHQILIYAASLQQFLMRTLPHRTPMIQDDYAVYIPHGT